MVQFFFVSDCDINASDYGDIIMTFRQVSALAVKRWRDNLVGVAGV